MTLAVGIRLKNRSDVALFPQEKGFGVQFDNLKGAEQTTNKDLPTVRNVNFCLIILSNTNYRLPSAKSNMLNRIPSSMEHFS